MGGKRPVYSLEARFRERSVRKILISANASLNSCSYLDRDAGERKSTSARGVGGEEMCEWCTYVSDV